MKSEAPKMDGISSMNASDFVYEAIKGAGKVGGYLNIILSDTVYYAGKYVAHLRSLCSGFRVPAPRERSKEGAITIVSLVKNDTPVTEADRREFYMGLGRDMVEATKSSLDSESLTIIDLSRYGK